MLRIIDMSEATFTNGSFAIWSTTSDSFIKSVYDTQAWTLDEFVAECESDRPLSRIRERVIGLLTKEQLK